MLFWSAVAICLQQRVEATVFRGVLRVVLTAFGGFLGYALMLNGSLAQNPYYVAGMTCLVNGLLGLLAPQKTFRYSLYLIAFTFNSITVCSYYGCCDLPATFFGVYPRILSTAMGMVYAVLISWLVFPFYTSEVLFSLLAGVVRDGLDLGGRMQEAAEAAAARGEPFDHKPWAQELQTSIRMPLARVFKELQDSTIDKKQSLVAYAIFPTPPLVRILLGVATRLADHLDMAVSVLNASYWPGPPGPAITSLLKDLGPRMDAVRNAASTLVEANAECMAATSRKDLLRTRKVVNEAVQGLHACRVKLREAFVAWNSAARDRPAWTAPDFRVLTWFTEMMVVVGQVEVFGVILGEKEETMDKDGYMAWLSAWYRRRPVYGNPRDD